MRTTGTTRNLLLITAFHRPAAFIGFLDPSAGLGPWRIFGHFHHDQVTVSTTSGAGS
jgi:hypothetical protein